MSMGDELCNISLPTCQRRPFRGSSKQVSIMICIKVFAFLTEERQKRKDKNLPDTGAHARSIAERKLMPRIRIFAMIDTIFIGQYKKEDCGPRTADWV